MRIRDWSSYVCSSDLEAASGDLAAAQADADAVRVTVAAEITRAYADAASAAERLGVAQHIVDLPDKSVALTARRAEVGLTTKLDTAPAAALRDQRRAAIPANPPDRNRKGVGSGPRGADGWKRGVGLI